MLPFKNNCTFYAIKIRNVFEDIIKDLLAANDDPTFHKSMFSCSIQFDRYMKLLLCYKMRAKKNIIMIFLT